MGSILNIIAVFAWHYSLSLSFLAVLIPLISFRYIYGIHKFRGPVLASFTDFWRLIHAYRDTLFPLRDLHDTYGDVVRIGPRALSFRHPRAIRDIFGAGKDWEKSGLYATNAPVSRGEWAHTLFSSPDQNWHRNVRRAMQPFFTQTAVFDYEPLFENTIDTFLKELEHRFVNEDGNEASLDVFTWISYFTFDVMSELTYSKRHDFIARSEDVHGIIGWVEKFLAYGNIVGQMPWIDSLLRHNPVLMWLEKRGWYTGTTFPGARFALERIAEREHQKDPTATNTNQKIDLLDKFRQAKKEHPEHITMKEVLGLSLSTMIAGSEPSAIGLTAVLYYVLRTPGCYQKLQQELSSYVPLATSSKWPQIPFRTARSIPYLHACIQEGFRLHPPLAINFERIVPSSGATICDNWIPAGTVVGVSPGVVQRHKATFGDDADSFRPERWLVDDEQKIRAMERAMFQYGAGNHMCLGRNIAVMEVYKLVPSLMCTFEMSMDDPEKEWTVKNWGIARPKDFKISIKRKQGLAEETAS